MKLFTTIISSFIILAACGQNTEKPLSQTGVGGPCEGCEAIHESPVPFDQLNHVDTLPGFAFGSNKMVISGTVYKPDGKTPAPGVVVYVYHTDSTGTYPRKGNEKAWGQRHGYLRGWMKTNEKGQYQFYTTKPGAYPGQTENPAHIHITIKEPDKNEYYIDDFLFDEDPLLTQQQRSRLKQRGGSGIVQLKNSNGLLSATRDILLGKNIPDYQ
jgi:protocatechuate 3,4-dioxygenase beta subunit